ncbi:HEAT repeat domain-containing protein [Streptomyces hydrogenans]
MQDNRTIVIFNNQPTEVGEVLDSEAASEALDAYARQIRAAYGRLDLEVLMPTTEGEHPKVQLREVFVPPMLRFDPPRVELPVELQRRLIECGELPDLKDEAPEVPGMDRQAWEQARQAYRERPAVGLLETLAAEESNRVVLLGDPGAGKSTLARFLALVLTSGTLDGPLESLRGLLPVVVELRRYADIDWRERSFEDFLAHVYRHEGNAPTPALLDRCLKAGQALVVFDGLDELFDPSVREDVTRRIVGFSARYPEVRIVVTSRIIGYARHVLDAAGFRHYLIHSLDDEQIASFAAGWYEAVYPSDKPEAERLRVRLTEAITRSRPVRELAGNPLLLTILAIISRRQRLPRDRAGVYQHAVNVLIAHWDEDTKHLDLTSDIRTIADLDDRDRREMLERLARHMQTGEGGIAGNHVLDEDVERVFTAYLCETLQLDVAPARKVARVMVKQFRERNFILSRYGSRVYGFVHRAFLEYLAAADIVRRYERRELTDEDLLDGIFDRHAPDATWHEVLLLIVGQVGERIAAQAIDRILELEGDLGSEELAPPAVLALRALAEVRRVALLEKQSIKTAKALTRFWEENHVPFPVVGSDTEASLHSLGPQWAGSRSVLRWLHASGGGIRSSAVAYSLIPDKEVLQTIAEWAPDPAARANALSQLSLKWRQEHDVFRFVMERSTQDPHEIVRSDALDVLADHWGSDPMVRDLVFERVTGDDHEHVRRWAVFTLKDHWSNDSAVCDLMRDRSVNDVDEGVRRAAIGALGDISGGNSDDRDLIWRQSIGDESAPVRSDALDALADHWGGDPTVRDLVFDRATSDDHEYVRRWAVVTLARHWGSEVTVRHFVLDRAVHDSHEDVRASALDVLARNWWDDSSIRETVLSRAIHDAHEQARSSLLGALAELWGDNPAVRDLAFDRASNDSSALVRTYALGLSARWRSDSASRDLVMDRAICDVDEDLRRIALGLLARVWGNESHVRDFVMERAAQDDSARVRKFVLNVLVGRFEDDSDVRELVQARATHDADGDVRSWAIETLAHWPKRPSYGDIVRDLRERACSDTSDDARDLLLSHLADAPDAKVRSLAGYLLGALWSADPRTIPALQSQVQSDPSEDTRKDLVGSLSMAEAYARVHGRLW